MAQTLKEDVRKRIEQAAIDQLVKNGMHKTNMRDIAKNAGITPGNLYRYYPSKDQLIISITKPIIDGINAIVQKETGVYLDLAQQEITLPEPPEDMDKLAYMELILLKKLRNALIEIGDLTVAYPQQMMVLLDDSVVSKHLYQWGISLIKEAYNSFFEAINTESDQINVMIKVVTMSFCEGVVELLKALLASKDQSAYVSMLDSYLLIQKAGIKELLDHELKDGNLKEKD